MFRAISAELRDRNKTSDCRRGFAGLGYAGIPDCEMVVVGDDDDLGIGIFRPDRPRDCRQVAAVERYRDRTARRIVHGGTRREALSHEDHVTGRANGEIAAGDLAAEQVLFASVRLYELEAAKRPGAVTKGKHQITAR